MDTGTRLIGVTAAHVILGWKQSRSTIDTGPLRIAGGGSSIQLDWEARVIDLHAELDIATFEVTEAEIGKLGKRVLTGSQREWPPLPPEDRCGIYYCGFPGEGTTYMSKEAVVFGTVVGSGIAHSISENDVSTVLERHFMIPAMGNGVPPENFEFGGISGGLMLAISQKTLRSWFLAGVIHQGPNTSDDESSAISGVEIIRARRAHFILPNGKLDVDRWNLFGGGSRADIQRG